MLSGKEGREINVILVIADSLRADYCGCYGSPWVRTPNIDALAAQGTRFSSCHAASFPTRPMRQDLHSGRYTFPHMRWGTPWRRGEKTLAEVLHGRGYATALIGDTPSNLGFEAGFDHFEIIRGQGHDLNPQGRPARPLPAHPRKLRTPIGRLRLILRNEALWRGEEDRYVAQTMRAAARWLESHYLARQPLFLLVDTFDPHEPWNPPRHYVDLYDPDYAGDELFEPAYEPAGYATEAEIRHMRCLYAAEVTLVDRWIGYLLDALERLKMADDTLVLLTSDHGFYHGEHGLIGKVQLMRSGAICRRYPLYDTILRVPLILRAPDIKAGRRVSGLCQPPDIMPTILDFACPFAALRAGSERSRRGGASIPATVQGTSLRPLIEGKRGGAAEAVASYTFLQDPEVRAPSTLRTDRWCYIYGGDESPSELYDLTRDPGEQHNILDGNHAPAERLHARYLAFLERIASPREYLDARREFNPKPRKRLPKNRWL
jgi:arylsulfatase A-like enzyme